MLNISVIFKRLTGSASLALLLCLHSASAASQTSGAAQQKSLSATSRPSAESTNPSLDDALNSKYDILGLKLGMTAKEAFSAIAETFHLSAEERKRVFTVYSTPSRFVPGRTYVQNAGYGNKSVRLVLNFFDVPAGEGAGPEMLWNIIYQPTLPTDTDKKAFAAEVIEKYGQPIDVEFRMDSYWADRNYKNGLGYELSGKPFLHLNSSSLTLSSPAIRSHMEAAFNSKKTAAPPL